MRLILIAIMLLISNVSLADDGTLLSNIRWKYKQNTEIGTIRSSVGRLGKIEKQTIITKYNDIKRAFFEFEKGTLCIVGPTLDLRIISDIEINSTRYFDMQSAPGYVFFGRYFREENILYITKEAALYNTGELAHELAHYFYDVCGIKFLSDELEHDRVRMFQKFLGVTER